MKIIQIIREKPKLLDNWSPSLELIEPVNFPLYEFSGRSEGEETPKEQI